MTSPDAPLVDVSSLTQAQATDYLHDLSHAFWLYPDLEGIFTEKDRDVYLAKIEEVKKHLETFG